MLGGEEKRVESVQLCCLHAFLSGIGSVSTGPINFNPTPDPTVEILHFLNRNPT